MISEFEFNTKPANQNVAPRKSKYAVIEFPRYWNLPDSRTGMMERLLKKDVARKRLAD